jgi:CheY-like chemotaxis protein
MPAVPFPRVLLVDDHRDTLDMYVIGLQASGFDVVPVDGAAAARAVLSTMSPDVIVTDVRLADECGIALARTLRTLPHLRRTPIVLLTGDPRHTSPDATACWQRVMLKPCTPITLADVLRAVLDPASLTHTDLISEPAPGSEHGPRQP